MAFIADSFKLSGMKHPEIDEGEEEMGMGMPGLIGDDPENTDLVFMRQKLLLSRSMPGLLSKVPCLGGLSAWFAPTRPACVEHHEVDKPTKKGREIAPC